MTITLDFTDELHKKCLITVLQQGVFRCYICKRPFIGSGFDCDSIEKGYDQRYISPSERCITK